MYTWRITKYDPKNRDGYGHYLKNEWTSYYDIGKIFANGQLTQEEYLDVERKYIQAATSFMKCMNVKNLKIVSLEKRTLTKEDDAHFENTTKGYTKLHNGQLLDKEMVKIVSQLALREIIWCKLESSIMYIHFGYDYYMYVGSKNSCENTVAEIKKSGLFC